MVDVSTCYISCGCNNSPHAVDWGKNGLVCYGSCNSVAIYQPQVRPFFLFNVHRLNKNVNSSAVNVGNSVVYIAKPN